ncbi:MAG: anti-sigma factor family protein [Gaiellaceae bacterium]
MSCKEFVELVTDYFERTLSDEDVLRFEAHLDHCPWCTRYVEQMRVTIRTVGRIDEGSISDEARDVLLDEFRNWHAA